MSHPAQFENVTAVCKANVYFDGKVVSHTIVLGDGSRKTLGVILPGEYHFNTAAPERMDITAGACRVKLSGEEQWTSYGAGSSFDVPGNDSFDIAVDEGSADYICSFLA
jgi:uncharacterized protein YaiE (UPF0345 family)